jgi:gentisate 1,2-dioxygenase
VAVVDGQGESQVGDQCFRWQARDVFTVPQHHWATHRALDGEARLFVVSDGDALRRLGLLAESMQAPA